MITQTGSELLIELDDKVAAEMAEAMASGLCLLPADGILASRWFAPRCFAGCGLRLDDETQKYSHAPDCPLPRALAVARLCTEVLSNVKLIDECLNIARQGAEALSAEGETMNGEPKIDEFKSAPPICPHCERLDKRNPLTPKGDKLECSACGNVFWASDPTWAKRNEVPR